MFPKPFGKYELLARIGSGGMAEIYRARLVSLGGFEKTLVIKRMLPELRERKASVDMFLAEARLAAVVQHKNVVQVFELGKTDDGELFIAMELVEGTDLRRLLKGSGVRKSRIPPWFSVHVMAEILEGLSFAHDLKDKDGRPRNIIHRDVTPSNIFISQLGDIKLADFGVAKDAARGSLTLDGQLKGKIPYMSPEQLYHRPFDARTDIFAAGTVLWECLAQRRLFGGRPEIETMNAICKGVRDPPSVHMKDIPPELDTCVLRAIEIDKDTRYPTAREFQARLLDVLSSMRPRIMPHDVRAVVESLVGPGGHEEHGMPEGSGSSGESSRATPPPAPAAAPAIPVDRTVEMPEPSHFGLEIGDPVSTGISRLESSLPRYHGPHPFYVRGAGVSSAEPLDYFTALALLKSSVEDPKGGAVEISANQTTWFDTQSFARLSGQEAVLRIGGDDYPKQVTFTGKLDTTSIAHVLGRIWRERWSGRLMLSAEAGGRRTRRELHVLEGSPTFAYSSSLKAQMLEFLLGTGVITDHEIPELVRLSLLEHRPIEQIAAQSRGGDETAMRAALMQERLVDAFSWTHGQLIFDSQTSKEYGPFAPTVLAQLLPLIERGVPIPRLRKAVAPHLDKPLIRSKRFARGTRDMLLSGESLRTVQRLGSGEPLIAILREDAALEPIQLAVAYAFLEVELLLPPP